GNGGGYFAVNFSPRVFNGNIQYSTGGGASTTIDFDCSNLGENIIEVTVTDASGNVSTCMATVNVNDVTAPIIMCYGESSSDQLINNGSFESGDFTGWTVVDFTTPFVPYFVGPISNGAGFFSDALPTDGGFLAGNGFDGAGPDESVLYQDVSIPTGVISATLSWDENIDYDLDSFCIGCSDRIYEVQIRDTDDNVLEVIQQVVALANVIDSDNVWNSLSVDLIAYAGQNIRIAFWQSIPDAFSGPAKFALDNVSLNVASDYPPITIELDENGEATIDPLDLIASTNEACGIDVSAADITDFTCADIGTIIDVTVFVSDASGNIAACVAQVMVVDLLAPVLTCPADQTQDPGPGNLFWEVPDFFTNGEATATDNCTDPVVITTQDPAAGTLLSDGVYTVTITAEDEYGNVSTCDFELTIESILGAQDNELNNAIAIYPNPANDQFTISNSSNIVLDNAMIYDINGKLVSQINLQNMQSEKVVNIANFASGVYMVYITGEQSSVVKRLIKE
ncbi:MAG: subtilisin, partial [Flavobacterium sp.]